MRYLITRLFCALLLVASAKALSAQTTYPITASINTSSFGAFSSCTNCIFNLSPGVVLTVNSNVSCTTCTFNGGTIIFNSGTVTLTQPDNFNNDTVIVNEAISPQSMNFNGDSVAFNAAVSYTRGGTTVTNSHISVNSALSLSSATFTNDSVHLNANLSFSNGIDAFSGSHFNVATGVTLSTEQATYTNSVFTFNGTSKLTDGNGFASTGSSFYLNGTSSISAVSASSITSSTIVMSGTNSFTSSNTLPVTNSDITIDAGSTFSSSSSLTVTGGAITNSGTLKASSTLTLSGDTLTLNTGSTTKVSTLAATNGSITATGGTITVSSTMTLTGDTLTTSGAAAITASSLTVANNGSDTAVVNMSGTSSIAVSGALSFTGTDITMGGSSGMTGSSGSINAGSTLTMSGTATLAPANGLTVSASNAYLDGNSVLSGGTVTVDNTGFILVGDNTGGTAHLYSKNTLSVLDNSSISIDGNNNYFQTTSNKIINANGNVPLTPATGSCGGPGENTCAMGTVFGCATMNNAGAIGCISLAIADVQLTATLTATGAVSLSWTDAGYSSAATYFVQRNTGNGDWTNLASVVANEYTGDYHFEDQAAPAGTISYRIARTGQDGNTAYSTTSTVTITRGSNALGIYPNPATGHTFNLSAPGTGRMVVNIFTLTGQLIMRTALQGQRQYQLSLPSQLTPGTTVIVQALIGDQGASFPLLLR